MRHQFHKEQVVLSGGGVRLPDLARQSRRRVPDLLFAAQSHRRSQGPLVRFFKGEHLTAVRLQVSDVDDLSPAHHGTVFQRRSRFSCGPRHPGKLFAGGAHAHRQRQAQIGCRQCTDPVQHADQVIDGKRFCQADDHRYPVVIQGEAAPIRRQGFLQQLLDGQCGQGVSPVAADVGQSHRPFLALQVDVQMRRPFPLRSRLDVPVQQIGVEQLPQNRQVFRIAAAEKLHVPPLRPLPVQLVLQPPQHGGQFIGVDGLQNVLHHVHLDGLLGVLERIKTGKDHEPGRREPVCQNAAQLQPIHKRHLDVRQDHVRPQTLRQFQSVLTVGGLPHQRESQPQPVHFPADTLADILLVIYQQHPVQFHGSDLLSCLRHLRRPVLRLCRMEKQRSDSSLFCGYYTTK